MSTTLRTLARRFKDDAGGQAAIIFGLAAIPLCVMMGMAVDLSKQVTNQKHLQATMDSAALAAAAAYGKGDPKFAAVAQQFFDANAPSELKGAPPVVNVSVDGTTLKLKASTTGTFKNSVMGLIGQGTTDIKVSTTVSLPVFSDYHKGEIVLVMDYSGSMNDSLQGKKKYIAMRDEAAKLLKALSQDGKNVDVKFGLVPFSGEVYATMANRYWYDRSTNNTNFSSCTRDRKSPSNTTDATPETSKTSPTRWGQPTLSSDPHGIDCGKYTSRKLTVSPLTTNHAATIKQVQDMTPYQWTNIAVGLEFGYHLLSPNAPFSEGVAYDTKNTLKAVVLLTDGEQTTRAWGPGNTSSVANGEKNIETLCKNMKTSGIRILTVSYDLSDVDTEKRLKECASSEDDFFDANTNEELAAAFGIITNKLAKLMYITE